MKSELPTVKELASRIHNTIVAPEATADDVKAFARESVKYCFGAVVVLQAVASNCSLYAKSS